MRRSIICKPNIKNIKSGMKKLAHFYVDLISPVSIFKRCAKNFKTYRKEYAILMIGLLFLGVFRIGFMDIDVSGFVNQVTDDKLVGGVDIYDQLKIQTGTFSLFGFVGKKIYDIIAPIGISFAVMYWLMIVVNMAVRDNFNVEQIAILFIKLLIPVILIDKGWDIITKLIEIGNSLLDTLKTTLTDSMAAPPNGELRIPFAKYFAVMFPVLILWGIGGLTRVMALMAIYTREIRLMLLAAFSPLSLADIAGEEHSQAIKLLKELLALGLQGCMMLAVNYAGIKLMKAEMDNIAGGVAGAASGKTVVQLMMENDFDIFKIVALLAISVTAMGLYSKSEDLAKQVVGLS